jgi:hypothetical protein
MDINRIVSRLQTFFDTDNINIPDPKIENRMDNIVQKTTSSDTITGSKDYSIANLLRALGIKNTPENQALILLIPLYGLPYNEESIKFILGKGHRASLLYEHLIDQIIKHGNSEGAKELVDCFPDIAGLPDFLNNLRSNMSKIWDNIIRQSDLLIKDSDNKNPKAFLSELYSSVLLQLDNNLPFFNLQVPIKIGDRIFSWEVWCSKERDIAYLEFALPNLNKVGCLLEDWKGPLKVTIYSEKKFHNIIQGAFPRLKSILKEVGYKCKSLEILDIMQSSGLLSFLSHFKEQYNIVDLSV